MPNPWQSRFKPRPPSGDPSPSPSDPFFSFFKKWERLGHYLNRTSVFQRFGWGVLLLLLLWLASGTYLVAAGQQGVVLLFGRYVKTTSSGLHWYFPWPFGKVYTPDVSRVQRLDIGYRQRQDSSFFRTENIAGEKIYNESLMLTGDQNIVDLNFSVFWRIKDAKDFLFRVRNPADALRTSAESAMREVVGQTTLQDILTSGKQEVLERASALLQSIIDSYQTGIMITNIELLEVNPPQEVNEAFDDLQRARQDKEKKLNEAEAYRNTIVPVARGQAQKIILDAEAHQEAMVTEAQGEAAQFRQLEASTRGYGNKLVEDRLAIETMERILSQSSKVVLDGSTPTNLLPYLNIPSLGKAGQKPPAPPSTPATAP